MTHPHTCLRDIARLLTIALCLGLPTTHAYPDGGVFVELLGQGQSSDQRAILMHDPGMEMETMVLSTRYFGDAADFGWLIPVPQLPRTEDVTTLTDGEEVFQSLFDVTEPRVVISSSSGWIACSSSGSDEETFGVRVVDRLTTGGLDIALLEAQGAEELEGWLADNGYQQPAGAAQVFGQYIAADWAFIAVKVAAASGRQQTGGFFPEEPLQITFPTDRLIFPLVISSLSSPAAGSDVLLYVFGQHRVRAENFPTVTMSLPGSDFTSGDEFRDVYGQAFDDALDQPDGRALVVEYAQPLATRELHPALQELLGAQGTVYLTRLRTYLRPQDMDRDVVLVEDESDRPVIIAATRTGDGRPRGALAASLFALSHLLLRRRRGSSRRQATSEAALVGLVVLIVLGL